MRTSMFFIIVVLTMSSTLARRHNKGYAKHAATEENGAKGIWNDANSELSIFKSREMKRVGKKGVASYDSPMASPHVSPVYSPTGSHKSAKSSNGKTKSASGKTKSGSRKKKSGSGKKKSASGKKKSASGKKKSASGKKGVNDSKRHDSDKNGSKGKKGEKDGDDSNNGNGHDEDDDKGDRDDQSPVAPVAIPHTPTPPPTSVGSSPSPAGSSPTPAMPSQSAPFSNADPNEDFYRVLSCGSLPEEFVKVEVSYIYNVRASDINSAIEYIEGETLKSVTDALFDCSLSRRRLNSLVGVSALPEDVPAGSCGEGCTDVVGGMSLYVEDQGESDFTALQCSVIGVIRNTMLDIESNDGGIEEISFVDEGDFDCKNVLDGTDGILPGLRAETVALGDDGNSTIPIVIGAVLGAALIAVFALYVAIRRRNDDSYVSVVSDKGDLVSIGTPESGAGDTHFSPQMSISTPNKESTFAALPDTPEQMIVAHDGSPIAQFDPAMLDAANRSSNNVNAPNAIVSTTGAAIAAKVGIGAALSSRFESSDKKNPPAAAAPTLPSDLLYDVGEYDTLVDAAMDQNNQNRPAVPPMLMRVQSADFGYNDQVVVDTSDKSNDLITSEMSEADDDSSVDTAAISNISPNKEER